MHNVRWTIAWFNKQKVRTLSQEHLPNVVKFDIKVDKYAEVEKKNKQARTMKRANAARLNGRQRFKKAKAAELVEKRKSQRDKMTSIHLRNSSKKESLLGTSLPDLGHNLVGNKKV